MYILGHRGLEPSKKKFFKESTFEAFRNQLQRGFGIEFDLNFTKDKKIVIFHDPNLERISQGKDKRIFSEMSLREIKNIKLDGEKICSFNELFDLIINNKSNFNALHLKGEFQETKYIDILVTYLEDYRKFLSKLLIFDIKIETAKRLKKIFPEILLAPSVAHEYDIERYGKFVNDTLISISEAIKSKILFDWVWLDEWDCKDRDKKKKILYTKENFGILKEIGFKISLITPELHRTSPGLLGGESHEDSIKYSFLKRRIKEIVSLKPDAICTDYPDLVRLMI